MAPPPPPPMPDARASGLSLLLLATGCNGQAADGDGQGGVADASTSSGNGASGAGNAVGSSSSPNAGSMGVGSAGVSGVTTGTGQAGDRGGLLGGPGVTENCDPGAEQVQLDARELLRPFAVKQGDFARRVIYSWTTAEQVAELQQDPTLLTRAMTFEGERGRAADVLLQTSATNPVAALLSQPEYANKRFGWSNPWATLLGWQTEQYGNRLIKITLRPEAWIARAIVDWSGQIQWAFADVEGNAVERDQVLAEPQRLGAVYFEDRRAAGCGTLQGQGAAFREYFVHNEAMVQSWAIDTQEIRAEIDAAVAAIDTYARALNDCQQAVACWPDEALDVWAVQTEAVLLVQMYSLGLAFPNDAYLPHQANLQALLDALGNVPFEEPLTHEY